MGQRYQPSPEPTEPPKVLRGRPAKRPDDEARSTKVERQYGKGRKFHPDAKLHALELLVAGNSIELVAAKTGIVSRNIERWKLYLKTHGEEYARRQINLEIRTFKEKENEIGPKIEMISLRKMADGGSLKDVNKELQNNGFNGITAVQYATFAKHPKIVQAREYLAEYNIRLGIGDKVRRVEKLDKLFNGLYEKGLQLLKKEELDATDAKVLKTVLEEGREFAKQVSVEVGDWVENISVEALVRSMTPAQLISWSSREEGDVIDTEFSDQKLLESQSVEDLQEV